KFLNDNFPKSAEGRVFHIGLKPGEIANRIIAVGDLSRAKLFLRWLDADTPIFKLKSRRGFLTITGKYKGVPVSIAGIRMGLPMMDFFVREARSIIDGPMIIIRLETCGAIGKATGGDVIIAEGSFLVTRNYDYLTFESKETIIQDCERNNQDYEIRMKEQPYSISEVIYDDKDICNLIRKQLINSGISNSQVFQGLNETTDSFYSSQGRLDENFVDYNKELIKSICIKYPEVGSLEMETFMLYFLAKCSTDAPYRSHRKVSNELKKEQKTKTWVDPDRASYLERIVGEAVLKALIEVKLDEEHIGD
ncbi:27999_t:CDS:2, partial [Racocetra persica]